MKRSQPHLFLRNLIKHPRTTGAIWPSSTYLVDEIVKQVNYHPEQYVVELGAGTGVVTDALLKKRIPLDKLIVIEYNPAFVKLLQTKFKGLHIIQGNAIELLSLLSSERGKVGTVVSSLPLRMLSKPARKKIVEQIYDLLPHDGRYIQFTYSYLDNDFQPFKNKIYSKRVWLNLPPARVDVFLK